MRIVHLAHPSVNDNGPHFDAPHYRDYSSLDHAWQLGFDAMSESFYDLDDVFPPADLTPAEAQAFRDGATEALKQCEYEMELSRTPLAQDDLDAMYDDWFARQEIGRGFEGHDACEW